MLAAERPDQGAALAELAPVSVLLAGQVETVAQNREIALLQSSAAGFAWQHPAGAISAFDCRSTSSAAQVDRLASAGRSRAY